MSQQVSENQRKHSKKRYIGALLPTRIQRHVESRKTDQATHQRTYSSKTLAGLATSTGTLDSEELSQLSDIAIKKLAVESSHGSQGTQPRPPRSRNESKILWETSFP